MKRLYFVLLLVFVGSGLFAQATDAQIRQAASTLGVPYEALKQLVDSYKPQDGVVSITIDDPEDIPFLHNDPRIKKGGTYSITVNAWYDSLYGNVLVLYLNANSSGSPLLISLKTRVRGIDKNDPVKVIFLYKPTSLDKLYAPSQLNTELVSITKR